MNSYLSTIYLIGVVQAITLAAALFLKKENRPANRVLSVMLLFVSLDLFELFAFNRGFFSACPSVPWMHIPYHFLYGPVLYLYASLMISRIESIRGKHLLHLAPFAILLVLHLALFYTLPDEVRPHFLRVQRRHGFVEPPMVFRFAGGVYEVAYLLMTLRILNRFSARLKDFFSSIEMLSMRWLRMLVVVTLVLMAAIYFHDSLAGERIDEPSPLHLFTSLGGTLFIFFITFGALIQPELFVRIRSGGFSADAHADTAPENGAGEAPPLYEKHRLTEAAELELLERLRGHMERDKPYLNEDLTLGDLAESVGIPSHQLSMLLNIHCRQNFFVFVNMHRVREVIGMMNDPEYLGSGFLAMAYRAGFNSKSTFNIMFKKITGMTPSAYRDRMIH